MNILYLACLLAGIGSMVLIDARYRLFFWKAAGRATAVLATGLAFFTGWDLLGISLGIFARGQSRYLTGITIAREFPVEELFFLAFLSYLIMVLITGFEQIIARRRGDRP